jgi:hypothetical protein
MPSDESFRLHDRQRVAPVEELREPHHRQTKRAVVRRGLVLRSWNKASCFRRKRFSATTAIREPKNSEMNVSSSVFYRNLCAFLSLRPNFCGRQRWNSRDWTPTSFALATLIEKPDGPPGFIYSFFREGPPVTTLGHLTIFRYRPRASLSEVRPVLGRLAVSRLRLLR